MPYVPNSWLDGPAGGTPITAATLTHLESQYSQAQTYADAQYGWKSRQPINAKDYGSTQNLTTLNAALDAAEARGKHTPVYVSGMWDVGNGLSMNGRTALLIGDGAGGTEASPTGTIIYASTQTGPVIDWTGWTIPAPGFGGKVRHGGFLVQGSNVADATLANCGMKFTAMSSATFYDIAIRHTGGPCIDMVDDSGNGVYLSDFERLNLYEPVSMNANDVPFWRSNGLNGNRLRSIGLRSVSHTVGPSGAVQINAGTFSPTDNLFDAWWTEGLVIPSGGTLFAVKGNSNVFANTQFFDTSKAGGATGTSFFRFSAPASNNYGGNLVTGVIPGAGGATDPDMGVDMRQYRNRVQGTKGYRGFSGSNVVIASGVLNTYVDLAGTYTPGLPAVIDNSGNNSNVVRDTTASVFPEGGTGFRKTISGRYYGASSHSLSTTTTTNNVMQAIPFWLPVAATFNEIDVEVTTTAASSVIRLGIYANDPVRDAPGTLILDAGTVDSATATGVKAITISQTLQAGLYWLAAVPQGGAPAIRTIVGSLAPVATSAFGGGIPTAEDNCYWIGSITGALANWTAAVTTSTAAPKIMLKAA